MKSTLLNLAAKNMGDVMGYLVAAILVAMMIFLGLGFLGYGVYLWLLPQLGLQSAAFLTGGLVLLVALLVACVACIAFREKTGSSPSSSPERDLGQLETGMIAAEFIREQVKANPAQAAIIALVGGAALGANPKLARMFIDMVNKIDG